MSAGPPVATGAASLGAIDAERSPASGVDRLLATRDRLLASPRFQRFAARFPPTRWIARRRSRALFDLVAGFAYSQVLHACVQFDWFDALLERPRTVGELAARTGLDAGIAERLVAAAIALRLLERRSGGRVGLGPLGAPLAGDRAIASMVEHHAALYADLADPAALLRRASDRARASADAASAVDDADDRRDVPAETRLGRLWGYAGHGDTRALDEAAVAAYSRLMTQSQPLVAAQILDAWPLRRHRCMVDVGGGEGTFAIAAARRHPGLAIRVFDLPAVADRARGGGSPTKGSSIVSRPSVETSCATRCRTAPTS